MSLTTKGLPPAPDASVRLRVRVVSGAETGRTLAIDRVRLIGSSDVCDLVLVDPIVSRRHVRLEPSGPAIRVRDLESKNGTWIDQTRIHDAEVGPGVSIRLGDHVIEVEPESERDTGREEPAVHRGSFGRFIGEADCLMPMYAQLERAAATDVTVLLEGESGTGKELLSEGVHEQSTRSKGPFVVVDCGAVPETLIESELFGHERGAFTGAERTRIGAFEEAGGGTIFLDEVGELPLALQTRLLRVLDKRQIKRIGGDRPIDVDVRVIAATNRNLDREVEEGRFRLDLFHRLAVVLIRVPPLRERHGDVELLARHFASVMRAGADPGSLITPEVAARMKSHAWPGNVRELRNYVERLALLGEHGLGSLDVRAGAGTDSMVQTARAGLPYREARAKVLELFADVYVEDMLKRSGGNVSAAARAAGIARRHFQRLKQEEKG